MELARILMAPARPCDIEELVQRHYEDVYRFCARRVGLDHAADATQETFLTAHKVAKGFRGESTAKTWLFGIANNQCKRVFRTLNLRPTSPLLDTTASPEQPSVIDRKVLQDAMDKLAPKHLEVVTMHEIDGMTYAEIAETLRIPEGTVKSRLHHAFAQLRRAMDGMGATL